MADAASVDAAPHHSLPADALAKLGERIQLANAALARRYPGDAGHRQPVHTVYIGAHLYTADTTRQHGRAALRALEEYAPDAVTLSRAIGLPGAESLGDADMLGRAIETQPHRVRRERPNGWLAHTVYKRVVERLRSEPVEDLRIDYEDGYGARSDAEEDAHAVSVARLVARGMHEGSLPPFIGIRVKPLTEELWTRSLRTLDLFLTTIMDDAGRLPKQLMLTLPKVSAAEQGAAFADALATLEHQLGLPEESLRFEVMVETPQLILDEGGRCLLPALIEAARGRLLAAHFGTYDYTASLGITAAYQRMRHPACDFARHAMQIALAGTGVWLSDGSTSLLPVPLPGASRMENRARMHRAWRMHYEDVRHSLAGGFYQGWDLHPAQLVTRYAALYAFFLEGVDAAAQRLRSFLAKTSQATPVGEVFEEAATGQGLLSYFLRGINSGAISEEEASSLTGLTVAELRQRSIVRILRGRQSVSS
jgi:citrate lyase beta subunit